MKKLNSILRDFIYDFFIKNNIKKGDKILITSTDGIGDFIVRDKLFLELIETYGRENVFVLVKAGVDSIVKKYGINPKNIFIFTREDRKKIKNSKNFLEKIASLGIKKIYALEFTTHDLWFMKYFSQVEKIGFDASGSMNKYFNKIVKKRELKIKNVTELTKEYLEAIFNRKYTLEEVRPRISKFYKKDEKYIKGIAFGVGSIERKRMMAPKKQEKILIALSEKCTDREIYLLGRGVLEDRLINEMPNIKNRKNIVNLVGKTSLEECNDIINSCELFVGMESGLYNMAFAMEKRVVGLFTTKETGFAHVGYSGVKVIEGKDGEVNYFGNPNLNGIKVSDVLEAVEEFLI